MFGKVSKLEQRIAQLESDLAEAAKVMAQYLEMLTLLHATDVVLMKSVRSLESTLRLLESKARHPSSGPQVQQPTLPWLRPGSQN